MHPNSFSEAITCNDANVDNDHECCKILDPFVLSLNATANCTGSSETIYSQNLKHISQS